MTPVAKTGLHCGGTNHRPTGQRGIYVTPVAKTGLHCGHQSSGGAPAGLLRDPGREDRAPLRPQRPGAARDPVLEVTPVAKTGLHCGVRDGVEMVYGYPAVTPVAKTGLHCGDLRGGVGDGDDRLE